MKEQIAVYWDFDNIHISVCLQQLGKDWVENYDNRKKVQPRMVDIQAIMEYITSLGEVNINRAYAEWSLFGKYSRSLQNYSIDLIQLFPRGSHMKNGADIRMAIDVVEDMHFHSHIDKIIFIGGDSDYIALAQKVRQKGKQIIGIGVRETTNPFLIKACNEFKIYSSLLAKSSGFSKVEMVAPKTADISEAKKLLTKAVESIMSKNDEEFAKKSAIKPMMIRLDPSFDESNYNFKTFAQFLDNLGDIITIKPAEHDHHIYLKGRYKKQKDNVQKNDDGVLLEDHYRSMFNSEKISLIEPAKLRKLIANSYNIIKDKVLLNSDFEQFKNPKIFDVPELEISKNNISRLVRLLKRCNIFEIDTSDEKEYKFKLKDDIKSSEELVRHIFTNLIKVVLDKTKENKEPVDFEILYNLVYENNDHKQEFTQIVRNIQIGD